uniref:Phorbol-ester/DAG-type domain-containing protein n=1 Tax=Pygocentrus nattereri TaxID=42514 RepID=A0AAR2JLU0_PYGNA
EPPVQEKFIYHKGHEFMPTLYHFPTNCEACTKPLWNMFKPPLALECLRCQIKCHKDHMDRKEEVLRPCLNRSMSLLALYEASIQEFHTRHLLKKAISRNGTRVTSAPVHFPNLHAVGTATLMVHW